MFEDKNEDASICIQ